MVFNLFIWSWSSLVSECETCQPRLTVRWILANVWRPVSKKLYKMIIMSDAFCVKSVKLDVSEILSHTLSSYVLLQNSRVYNVLNLGIWYQWYTLQLSLRILSMNRLTVVQIINRRTFWSHVSLVYLVIVIYHCHLFIYRTKM